MLVNIDILKQSRDNTSRWKPPLLPYHKSQCPSPTPNISTQLWCLGPQSALLSRIVCSSLGPSPSCSSNCLNIMCLPVNCPLNLIQSGLWAAVGFRLPFARRPQSNDCSRGDTRALSLARAFFHRFVTRNDWRRRLNGVGSRAQL